MLTYRTKLIYDQKRSSPEVHNHSQETTYNAFSNWIGRLTRDLDEKGAA